MLAKMETEIERLQRQHESDRQEAQSQKLQLIEKLKVLVESNERLRRERDESPKSTPISASPSSTNHEIFSTTHSSSIEVEKLKEKIESLESMISEQNSQINSCRQQVEEATLNLQSEVEKNMVLAEEIEAMQSQNGAESDRLVYLEQKHQELITENQKLSQVAESSQVEAKDKNNQLAVLSERVDQLEKLRETWLVEINDKKSISDALSKTSDRLAKLQTENQTLLGHLEELRSRHVQIVDEKLQLAESLHYERRKSVMLDEEIKNVSYSF